MIIGERLKQKVEEMGKTRQWLSDELQKLPNADEIEGTSYASIHSYWRGDVEPPLSFLLAAADLLDVSAGWLILGDRPADRSTTLVPGTMTGSLDDLSQFDPVTRAAYAAIPELERLSPAVTSMFLEALTRLAGSGKGFRQTPQGLRALAKDLWSMVRFPLGKLGFRKTIQGRAETDYAVAMLQTLMLVMEAEGPRGPPGPKGKGSPRADRTR